MRAIRALLSLVATPVLAHGQTSELAKLLASDGGSGDNFGTAVSVSRDHAIVGASDDDLAISAGAAYVFERQQSGAWLEVAELHQANAAAFDFFGSAVAIDGDRALVGAYGETSLGATHVFERQASGAWIEVARLVASDGASGDQFGVSVALEGDRALVGANGDDVAFFNSGSAYVFERTGAGTWVEAAKLLPVAIVSPQRFGFPVSLSGDRALVGIVEGLAGPGKAHLFERQAGGTWTEATVLEASDGSAGDQFGSALSLDGDRAVLGAFTDDDQGADSGSAYVFERPAGGLWDETAKLTAADGASGDWFGSDVSLRDDCILVGADGDGGASNTGSAYVFRRSGGSWVQDAKLEPSDIASSGGFGNAVALSDGRALVGVFADDELGTAAGAAYLFDLFPLSSVVTQISLAGGGSQPLEIDAGHLHAGENYLLLGSMSGTSPGISLAGGLVLPLNPDRYFVRTLERPNLPPLANSKGSLNTTGHADATFTTAPLDVNLAGLTVHHAFVTIGSVSAASTGSSTAPAPSPALATFASNAFPLLFVP